MEFERRGYESSITVETRGSAPVIVGHAAVFGVLSNNLGGFREQIAPEAFKDVMGDDVRGLVNHDHNLILGRTKSGTMRLSVDTKGLMYEIDPPDTRYAQDLIVSLKRGDISQSSFAFRVAHRGDDWKEDENGVLIRTVNKVSQLLDVSPVTYPAYPQTDAAKRSMQDYLDSKNKHRADLARRDLALREMLLRVGIRG